MRHFITLCALCIAFSIITPAAAQDFLSAPFLTLSSSQLSIRLAPKKAWTIDTIEYEGKALTTTSSNYGMVIDLGGNKFVGSGHTEGGQEQITELTIEADGKPIDFMQGGNIKGSTFTVKKKSQIAFLDVESILRLSGDTLEEEHNVTVRETGRISKMYGFMFAWNSATSEWMAQTVGGRSIEGKFDNEGWEMQEDVRWSALFNPTTNVAVVTEFPADLPASTGRKHAYWDLAAYHKQYYQPFAARELKAGEKYHFAVKVRVFSANATTWKDVIRDAVDVATPAKSTLQQEIEQRFPPIAAGEKPDWLVHPVAMEALDPHTVLKPWTPVLATNSTVDVWNRRYQIGNWGLPRQVQIGGQDFLSAPLSLQLKLGDGENIAPKPQLKETFPGIARFGAQTNNKNIQITSDTAYEYDGFVRTDIEIKSTDMTARQFELVIPFKPENAKYFSAIHASSLKMESQQQHSISAAIPEGDGEVWSSDFHPLIWIGNEDAGLCWFSESHQYWSPEINPKAIRIVRHQDRVELRISFIANTTALPHTMKMSFGLMATPVKPRPAGWRGWNLATHQSTAGHTKSGEARKEAFPKGDQVIFWHDSWRIVLMYPRARDPQAFRDEVDFLKHNGASRVYPYTVASHLTGSEKTHIPGEDFVFTTPEWKAFGKDWELNPNRTPENFRRMSPGSTFADFHLSTIKDWITKDGVNGVYVDEAYPYPDTVAAHGMGYIDSKGVRQPTYQIYSMRNYFKRMAYLFQRYSDGPPAIIAHASGVLTMPFLSFADVFVDGEQVYHSVRDWKGDTPPSYFEMTPLDQWRAEFSGRQFGYVPVLLPELRPNLVPSYPDINQQIAPTREMLALAQLHDMLVWPLWSNAEEWRKVLLVRQEFNIGGADVQFFPYWNREAAVETNQKEVLVSAYTGKRGILAVVANTGEKARTASLDFSRLSMKIGADWKSWNAQTESSLPRQGNKITLEVPAKDFILVRIAP